MGDVTLVIHCIVLHPSVQLHMMHLNNNYNYNNLPTPKSSWLENYTWQGEEGSEKTAANILS